MPSARRTQDRRVEVMRCRSSPPLRGINMATAAVFLGFFYLMPCNSQRLNLYDQGSGSMDVGLQYRRLQLMEFPSSGSPVSDHAADSIGAHLAVADDRKPLSTQIRQRGRRSILGRKLSENISVAEHEELHSNEEKGTVHEAEKSNSNSHVGNHRHRHQVHRRSAGHEANHPKHLPAPLKHRINKSTSSSHPLKKSHGDDCAVESSETEVNSLSSKKISTVSWHKPRDEKYDQPTFHVDYSGPKTHPPKNN